MPGEHIASSASNAIALAAKHNCRVRMVFNGVAISVSKHMSASHIVRTWQKTITAMELKRKSSPAYKREKKLRAAEVAMKQRIVDLLVEYLPESKEYAMEWLSKWIPMADQYGVDGQVAVVAAHFRSLGFIPNQHVGDREFKAGIASRTKTIEYIGGQVVSMLESVGCVHPLIADWAKQAFEAK